MRVAAYQFEVSGDIDSNLEIIKKAIKTAKEKKVDLLVFPECALSGYPPRDIPSASDIDSVKVEGALKELQALSDESGLSIIVGTVLYVAPNYYNRAYFLTPENTMRWYGKRALYGWDEENFAAGVEDGVFTIGDMKVGVRICYEVRFPEYFRELYKDETDLNIVILYDVSDSEDKDRYQMIRSHLITRAVENVTPILSVNAVKPFQTAPTLFADSSGVVCEECEAGVEGMLIHDYEKAELDFGELGRKRYSDMLVGK